MAPKSGDLYSTFGSVPEVTSQGGGGTPLNVRSNPGDFGGQIGGALSEAGKTAEGLGSEGMQLATHYAKMATEAKVNDNYANKYTPAAANLRAQYDSLRGPDKVHGYESYISGLQDLNSQFTSSSTSPYEKQLMGGLINRHVAGEIDGAKRELVQAQKVYSDQSYYDLLKSNTNYAASNYNNPALVDSVVQQSEALTEKHHIDSGHDPLSPEGSETIYQAQQAIRGDMTTAMINRALSAGDPSANELRATYAKYIPGYQQLNIDSKLHAQNVRQTGVQAVSALKAGNPLPDAIGAPPSQVRAVVADTAQTKGIGINHALAVLHIESADGKNVGTRGDIGQTGKGGDLPEQASNMCDELQKAREATDTALGRPSQEWEQYVTYQQGASGGPALLRTAEDDPNAKAVDVLRGFYKNSKDALAAITGNGGNASMSATDFVDLIHRKYDDAAKRSAVSLPEDVKPSEAILAPHSAAGPAVQSGATPMQALMNFDKQAPDIIDRINAIPNIEQREGVMAAFKRDRESYSAAATAYKSQLLNQAGQLAADPKFTSMDQVPPELFSVLATDSPMTIHMLETRADYNMNHAAGAVTKDMREYGAGFYDLFKAVHSGVVSGVEDLQSHVGKEGDLTIAGYDRLVKELQGKGTPEEASEAEMKKAFVAGAKAQIAGTNETLGMKDPKGEMLFANFLMQALPVYDKGRGEGKSAQELLGPDGEIAKLIPQFKRTPTQMAADMSGTEADRTLQAIIADVRAGKLTQDEGKAEALKMGFIRAESSQVPRPE